jgi:predicted DNA-binding helix-hairpin-helix protein
VNTAERTQLLRIPGIGPKSADRILRARRQGRLSDLSHLRTLGIAVKRAAPFVLLDGHRAPRQLTLWGAA